MIEEPYKKEFESKIQPTNKCWYWNGIIDKSSGRGKFKINRKSYNVCVIAWELAHGEKLPEGMVVKQSCMVPACVKPDHLELGRKTFGWLT